MLPAVRVLAALLVGTVAVAGCRTSEGTPAEPTVPTAASTTATTAPIDVSVIPPTIDEPYLTAVLAALDEVDGEATRMIVAAKNITPASADYLNAIYSDESLQRETDGWFESLADDPELLGVRPDPGNRRTTVERVIAAAPHCVGSPSVVTTPPATPPARRVGSSTWRCSRSTRPMIHTG